MLRNYSETLAVNATSSKFVVEGGDENTYDGHLEPISLTLRGTFGAATCTLQVSHPSSPLSFVAADAFTTAGAHNFELVPGMYFRFVNSASGSPQASITYTVRGEIKVVA